MIGKILATVALLVGLSSLHNPALAQASGEVRGSSDVFSILLMCGLMGLIGQSARVLVGMKTLADTASSQQASISDVFNLARLVFSLIVGFIAGVVTALVQWHAAKGLTIDVTQFDVMIPFVAAGYIGTDVVEAFTNKFFEGPGSIGNTNTNSNTNETSQHLIMLSKNIESLSGEVSKVGAAVTPLAVQPKGSIEGTDYPAWALSRDMKIAHGDYWEFITKAAVEYTLPISVICAIGSKESHWGLDLTPTGPTGTGDWTARDPKKWGTAMPTDGGGWGRGLMQIDWYSHDFAKTGNWKDPHDNILFGCGLLANLVKTEIAKKVDHDAALLWAVSAYNGQSGPKSPYCLDVMARANWISQQGLDR